MAAPFADPAVGVVTGRKSVLERNGLGYSESLYWRYESAIRKAETRLGSVLGVNGEIFAVRRRLYSPGPTWVVNDDSWIAMEAIKAGHRSVYNERAVSMEPVSATAAEEAERRARIVAGLLAQYSRISAYPWRRPIVMWQLVSHKLLRPILPIGMAGALYASLLATIFPPEGSGWSAVVVLAPPFGAIALGLQILFLALALIGDHLGSRIGRLAYVPKFFIDSMLAQIRGWARHLGGRQPAAWEKAARSPGVGVRR
jgi:hypothetical protein